LLVLFILVSCAPVQEQETPTAAPPTTQPTAAPLPTDTAVPPTPNPETAATDTAVPATPTIELLPTATAEPTPPPSQPVSLPTGQIIFLWDPTYVPIEGGSRNKPSNNLYIASPGTTPENWNVQPVLSELYGFTHFNVSPDKREIALTILEDTNGDGLYDPRMGIDIENIYIYTLATDSLTRLTNNQRNLTFFNWLPDRQGIVYEQLYNLFWAPLDGSGSQPLTNNPTPPTIEGIEYNLITRLATSPDGRIVALNLETGIGAASGGAPNIGNRVAFFDINSLELTIIDFDSSPASLDKSYLKWSPDNQWFAFTRNGSNYLAVMEMETRAIIPLITGLVPSYPTWSPDSRWLAFWQESSLMLWDSQTQTSRELANTTPIGPLFWSPDGSQIAVSFLEGEQSGILLITPDDNSQRQLHLPAAPTLASWLPDGEWLAFVSEQNDESGLYIASTVNGTVYQVIDSSGVVPPYDIVWLPAE
jgi:Tol biopolymer transport system component